MISLPAFAPSIAAPIEQSVGAFIFEALSFFGSGNKFPVMICAVKWREARRGNVSVDGSDASGSGWFL